MMVLSRSSDEYGAISAHFQTDSKHCKSFGIQLPNLCSQGAYIQKLSKSSLMNLPYVDDGDWTRIYVFGTNTQKVQAKCRENAVFLAPVNSSLTTN